MTNEIKLTYDRQALENEILRAMIADGKPFHSEIGIINFVLSYLEKKSHPARVDPRYNSALYENEAPDPAEWHQGIEPSNITIHIHKKNGSVSVRNIHLIPEDMKAGIYDYANVQVLHDNKPVCTAYIGEVKAQPVEESWLKKQVDIHRNAPDDRPVWMGGPKKIVFDEKAIEKAAVAIFNESWSSDKVSITYCDKIDKNNPAHQLALRLAKAALKAALEEK